jgi:hypothetical protein
MAEAAERVKMMRQRRRARGLRELRLVVADPRSRAVRRRVAKQVGGLDMDHERDATDSKFHAQLSAGRCGIFRHPTTISCKTEQWRAIQNKTANSYAIEIAI